MAHDHSQSENDHPRPEAESPVPAEAFDAGQQSLVDALHASFWLLKVVMIGVVVLFLGSNIFIVDRDKQVAVLLRFGEQHGVYRDGIHWAFPYPIDQVIKVPISAATMTLDSFWFQLRPDEKTKDLSELMARSGGLEPGVDGALLTGDRAIMNMLIKVQYHISNAEDYVQNVPIAKDRSEEQAMLTSVLKNAAVASAARTTANVIWKRAATVADDVRARAQKTLDDLHTGIQLDTVAADKSYFPLQVKDAVINVTTAENQLNETIQKARKEQQEKLNEAAGEAWQTLWEEIQKLDQLPDGPQRDQAISRLEDLLASKAAGKAGQRIQEAKQQREQIVENTRARKKDFESLLEPYRANPELLRKRLLTDALKELYAQPGVVKWMLPGGENKQIDLWLNPDPKEFKEAQERATQQKASGKKAGAGG